MKNGLLALLAFSVACGASRPEGAHTPTEPETELAATEEAPPMGRLPDDVTPTAYTLSLKIVPSEERFSGEVHIAVHLDAPRSVIWLHGRDLNVSRAQVVTTEQALDATWETLDGTEGVSALRLPSVLPAGDATIDLTFDAPFNHALAGLYRVDVGTDAYAFTQFEAISARYAFPCFDEPRFKTPFDLTLTVREEHVAAANTLVAAEAPAGEGMKRVQFTRTEPLPTYLVAMAVGPLEVVESSIPPSAIRTRSLPFRGLAARGHGAELAHAMQHTPGILTSLEAYFGMEYPYDKLDIVAVPDFASGAMENAGLVTFREWLLLVDEENGTEGQKRAFAGVMAHELAHMWFGDLVTMPWWDDIWLNEAFATWMGNKIVQERYPEHEASTAMLLSVEGAMGQDSLVNARQIRQPIESNHDIRNAFDSITYQKGGGVLSMFERWVGQEQFRDGVRAYMREHRFGNATSDDLLRALGAAANRDVATPFRTFLEQSGVPLVEAEIACGAEGTQLRVRQSRYLPTGSTGERARTWQIPLCVRYPDGRDVKETCSLVTDGEASIPLDSGTCPAWVMPNADAAGYFRFALAGPQLAALRSTYDDLSVRERVAIVDSLRAGYSSGTIRAEDALAWSETLVRDGARPIAMAPSHLLYSVMEEVADDTWRPNVESYARKLYGPLMRRLGYTRRARESSETSLLRASVASVLLIDAKDPGVLREAARRGRTYLGYGGDNEIHDDAVAPELVGLALRAAIHEGDAALWDALLARMVASQDAAFRNDALGALSTTEDPALRARAFALVLDERLRENEIMTPLFSQMALRSGREAARAWVTENLDALATRLSPQRAGATAWLASAGCNREEANRFAQVFESRIETYAGGPRNLASALEAVSLCEARTAAQAESAKRFFETHH